MGPLEARAKATYGSDLTDHLMSGGYVQTLAGGYEALRVASAWMDLQTRRPTTPAGAGAFGAGLFTGLSTNLGADCDLTAEAPAAGTASEADAQLATPEGQSEASVVSLHGVVLRNERTRVANMDYVWRLAPRLVYSTGTLTLSAEVEVTSALYASGAQATLRPERATDDSAVTNVRTLLSAFYHF